MTNLIQIGLFEVSMVQGVKAVRLSVDSVKVTVTQDESEGWEQKPFSSLVAKSCCTLQHRELVVNHSLFYSYHSASLSTLIAYSSDKTKTVS